jgi:hypothetical protein
MSPPWYFVFPLCKSFKEMHCLVHEKNGNVTIVLSTFTRGRKILCSTASPSSSALVESTSNFLQQRVLFLHNPFTYDQRKTHWRLEQLHKRNRKSYTVPSIFTTNSILSNNRNVWCQNSVVPNRAIRAANGRNSQSSNLSKDHICVNAHE